MQRYVHSILRLSALFAAIVVPMPRLAAGQESPQPTEPKAEAQPAAGNADEYILRTYDVGELLLSIPD